MWHWAWALGKNDYHEVLIHDTGHIIGYGCCKIHDMVELYGFPSSTRSHLTDVFYYVYYLTKIRKRMAIMN